MICNWIIIIFFSTSRRVNICHYQTTYIYFINLMLICDLMGGKCLVNFSVRFAQREGKSRPIKSWIHNRCVCVLPAGHQGLSWTSVSSHGSQLSGQREVQQAQTQDTGETTWQVSCLKTANCFYSTCFCCWQDLEQMAREQDRESDGLAIQAETESHRRQMQRCVDINTDIWYFLNFPLKSLTLFT